MYYQDSKKKLMATLRQNGPPTLFSTFSCCEFDWNELVQKTYETVHKTKVNIKFIEDQEPAWKNKLVIANVMQSTLHFSKRTDKIMSLLLNSNIFTNENVQNCTDSYVYRVEFQARGAPHIHCLLWLKGENGETPPSTWQEENAQEVSQKFASFGGSMIYGRAKDINCNKHPLFNPDCDHCEDERELVEKYQCHRHTCTCKKKGKFI